MGIATRWRSPGLWIRKSKISYGRLELEFFPSLPPTGTIKSAVRRLLVPNPANFLEARFWPTPGLPPIQE
jgi:hypothetical protein